MSPRRIQLRRTKGWRKPEGCIVVARPSRWGNPHRITKHTDVTSSGHRVIWWQIVATGDSYYVRQSEADAIQCAVDLFRVDAARMDLTPLRGHDLACWCPIGSPCHADVLLELANRPGVKGEN